MALLVILLASGAPAQERLAKSPLVGKLAPSIDGTTTTGEKFTLDRLRGQWVVVNFFGSWCTPCIQEHPELVAFSDSPTNVQRFFEERGGTWPVLARDTNGIAVAYGVIKVPETYLVAPTQLIVAKLVGGVTADGLDALIAKYSAPASTR